MARHALVPVLFAGILAAVLADTPRCDATNHHVQLDEVMAGCGGDPHIQFVELLFPQGQKLWGNGCAELAFFDANGTQTAVFPFPHNVPNDSLPEGNSALIATQAFAALPGAPRPDFIIPPFVAAPGGKVCFRGSRCFLINICLSYGPFRGDTEGAGGPAPALPILGATSVQRFQRFEDPGLGTGSQFNSDFRLGAPAPRNDEGTAGIVVESGGTCHVAPPSPPCSVTDIGSATVVSLNGTTQGASNVLGGSCGGADAPEQVFLYTAPRSGSYAIDTRGSTLDTVLYVLDGSCRGTELACDHGSVNGESGVVVTLTAGQQIAVVVDGAGQASGQFALNVTAPEPRCGNGVLEAGEECDDGNTIDGDCCSQVCRFEPSGGPCTDDGDRCTTDRCDGSGTCEHASCGGCLTCDLRVGCVEKPAQGCALAMPRSASLRLTNFPADGKDRLVWHWKAQAPVPKADFGDPLHATDYRLCVYDDGPALRLQAAAPAGGVCAGARCWTKTPAGFDYEDTALTPDGLLSVRLNGAPVPAKSTITVAGKGPRLGVPSLSLRTPLTVQLRKSDGNACWQARYSEVHVSPSGARLTAKSD